MDNCATLDYPKRQVTRDLGYRRFHRFNKYVIGHIPERNGSLFPERRGKTAALNRAMPFIKTSYTIFTDANTMLNVESIKEIMTCFTNPKTGCVAGEKTYRKQGQRQRSFKWRRFLLALRIKIKSVGFQVVLGSRSCRGIIRHPYGIIHPHARRHFTG